MLTAETIEIRGPFGAMPVQGFRRGELAVHQTLSDGAWWTITHLPTGLSFGFRWRASNQAINAMEALRGLRLSWKCSALEVEATPGIFKVLTRAGGRQYTTAPRSVSPRSMNGY